MELAAVEKEQGFSSANTLSPNDSTYHVVRLGHSRSVCFVLLYTSVQPLQDAKLREDDYMIAINVNKLFHFGISLSPFLRV